jgi:hypothetical protein
VVGGWLQIHQPEVFPPYFPARKKNPEEELSGNRVGGGVTPSFGGLPVDDDEGLVPLFQSGGHTSHWDLRPWR